MRWLLFGRAIIPVCALLGAGCVVDTNPSTAGPAGRASSTTSQPAAPTVTALQTVTGMQPTAVPAAIIQVSPGTVPVGTFSVSLAFEPARHLQDETKMFATADQPASATPQPTLVAGPPSQGAVVLSDMVHVTNNLDPTQPAPLDSAQAIIRHAVVEVMTGDSRQLVPYLAVTMDLLLDGHPVNYGQTLVPMFTDDGAGQRVYYGNNIRLPARGTFQIFVRMNRTPLLGQDTPPAAQFTLAVQ